MMKYSLALIKKSNQKVVWKLSFRRPLVLRDRFNQSLLPIFNRVCPIKLRLCLTRLCRSPTKFSAILSTPTIWDCTVCLTQSSPFASYTGSFPTSRLLFINKCCARFGWGRFARRFPPIFEHFKTSVVWNLTPLCPSVINNSYSQTNRNKHEKSW